MSKIKIFPSVYPDKITITQSAVIEIGKLQLEATVEGTYTVPDNARNMEQFFRTDIALLRMDTMVAVEYEIIASLILDAEEWLPIKIDVKPTFHDHVVRGLAKRFSKVLKQWLGKETMAEVVRINAESDDSTCASHDYCDANMAMDEAFNRFMGRAFVFFCDDDPSSEANNAADTDLINAAWSLAKSKGFNFKK